MATATRSQTGQLTHIRHHRAVGKAPRLTTPVVCQFCTWQPERANASEQAIESGYALHLVQAHADKARWDSTRRRISFTEEA